MVGAIVRGLLCNEATDQCAMTLEAKAEPAGFGSEISEGHQDAETVGVGQGVDGSGGEGVSGRSPVALLAELPPGLELGADGFGEIRKGGRGLALRSAARGGA